MSSDIRQVALLEWLQSLPGIEPENLHMISGDASFRRYFRFQHAGKDCIAVDSPPDKEKNHEFAALSEAYLQHGVPVPEVTHVNFDDGFLMLQDFGNALFSERLTSDDAGEMYRKALSHLPHIQEVTTTHGKVLPGFDRALLEAEFYLFNHWLLAVHLGLELDKSEWQVIHDTQRYLSEVFLSQPEAGVHRDYHSRNLMMLEDGSIGIIDFQDAVVGPITYDAVSLLRDCYVVWPDEFVYEQLSTWHQAHYAQYEWEKFKQWFDCTGMQRHIKASGIFARLCHRDGKTSYLEDIPRTLEYLVKVGQNMPQCVKFADLVADKIIPAVMAKALKGKNA